MLAVLKLSELLICPLSWAFGGTWSFTVKCFTFELYLENRCGYFTALHLYRYLLTICPSAIHYLLPKREQGWGFSSSYRKQTNIRKGKPTGSYKHFIFSWLLSLYLKCSTVGVFMNEKRWLRDKDNKMTFLGRWYSWFILRKGLFSCFSFLKKNPLGPWRFLNGNT